MDGEYYNFEEETVDDDGFETCNDDQNEENEENEDTLNQSVEMAEIDISNLKVKNDKKNGDKFYGTVGKDIIKPELTSLISTSGNVMQKKQNMSFSVFWDDKRISKRTNSSKTLSHNFIDNNALTHAIQLGSTPPDKSILEEQLEKIYPKDLAQE